MAGQEALRLPLYLQQGLHARRRLPLVPLGRGGARGARGAWSSFGVAAAYGVGAAWSRVSPLPATQRQT